MNQLSCPGEASLSQLVQQPLSEADAEAWSRHIEQCEPCGRSLDRLLASDSLAAALRGRGAGPTATPLPPVRDLIARLRKLRASGREATPSPPSSALTDTPPPPASPALPSQAPPSRRGPAFLAPPRAAGEMGWLGPFRVLKQLGAGGMGMVLLAEDTRLERRVALKVMRPELKQAEQKERFLREARAAAKVRHDHVVTIFEVNEEGGVPYLAMELLDGESLENWLGRGQAMPLPAAIRIVREVAEGLAAAHAQGLIHRDIKPGNLWLESAQPATPGGPRKLDRVKILDFGLARPETGDVNLTTPGAIVGTPAYASPEQFRGEAEPRSDLFSLGVVLYRLLTGKMPFKGDNLASIAASVLLDTPQSPREVNPEVPPALSDLVIQMLAKEPKDRPASAREVADQLLAIERSLRKPTTVKQNVAFCEPKAPAPGSPRTRRRIALAAALAAVVLVLVTSVVIILRDRRGKEVARVKVPDGGSIEVRSDDLEEDDANAPDPADQPAMPPAEATPTVIDLTGKEPMPDAAALGAAREQLARQYQAERASLKKEDRLQLANRLLERVAELEKDKKPEEKLQLAAARYALLELAANVAAEADDLAQGLKICDQIAGTFAVNPFRVKEHLLRALVLRGGSPAEVEKRLQTTLGLGFSALALDSYAEAANLAALARELAPRGEKTQPHWDYQVGFLTDEAKRGAAAYERVRPFLQTLFANPEAPQANREAGLYACFVKNDWEKGLRLLARGDDAELRKLAAGEMTSPKEVAGMEALGDAWWNAGEKVPADAQVDYRRRARRWYLAALNKSDRADRPALAARVVRRIDAVPVRPVTLRIRIHQFFGTPRLFIGMNGVHFVPGRYSTVSVLINHLESPGGNLFRNPRNTGASLLYPDAVEFGTFEFTGASVSGNAIFRTKAEPAGIEVQCINRTSGRANVELIATFQSTGFSLASRYENDWRVKYYAWQPKDPKKGIGEERDVRAVRGWDHVQKQPPVAEERRSSINFAACYTGAHTGRAPSPAPNVPQDHFALVGTTEWELPAGRYELAVHADDGVRIFLDGRLRIDRWNPDRWPRSPAEELLRSELELAAGKHTVKVEYFQCTGFARLQFVLRRLGPASNGTP